MGLLARPGAAQETPEQPTIELGSVRVRLGGLLQVQTSTALADRANLPTTAMRRARLDVRVHVNDLVQGRITPDFAIGDDVQLQYAYVRLAFAPAFQVVAGTADRPFSLLDEQGADEIVPIERGARFRGRRTLDLYRLTELVGSAGRSLGVQVQGEPANGRTGVSYAAGYFRGALGEDLATPGPYDIQQLAGRFAVRPTSRLLLGAAVSNRRYFAVEADDATGAGGTDTTRPATGSAAAHGQRGASARRGTSWEADLQYGRSGAAGPLALVTYATGVLDPFRGGRFRGAQGWVAYRTRALSARVRGVEPLLRASWGDPQGRQAADGGVLWTPGVNVYFGPAARLMVDVDRWNPRAGTATTSATSAKAQLQLAF